MSPLELGKIGPLGEAYRDEGQPLPVGCVIILDFDRPDLTQACVRSVLTTWLGSVVVVENGSTELRSELPDCVEYLHLGANLGFSGGMNSGIRLAHNRGSSFVLLLNNDARVGPGAIDAMFDCLNLNPQLAIVTPARGPRYRSLSVGGPSADVSGEVSSVGKSETKLVSVARVTGCCMAIRLSSLYQTGLLDEDFFFGREDDELSCRMLAHGYGLAELSGIAVDHAGGSSAPLAEEEAAKFVSYHYSRGEILLARKTSRPLLLGATRAVLELLKISLKGYLVGGYSPTSVVVAGIRGMKAGAKARLNPPPFLSQPP